MSSPNRVPPAARQPYETPMSTSVELELKKLKELSKTGTPKDPNEGTKKTKKHQLGKMAGHYFKALTDTYGPIIIAFSSYQICVHVVSCYAIGAFIALAVIAPLLVPYVLPSLSKNIQSISERLVVAICILFQISDKKNREDLKPGSVG